MNAPRDQLCLARLTRGWCALLEGHDDECTVYPRMPIVELGAAAAALNRIFAKAGR